MLRPWRMSGNRTEVRLTARVTATGLTVLLCVGQDLVALRVRFIAVQGDLQRVNIRVLVLDHLAEEHPGRPRLVAVLVVHRVLVAEVLRVLSQHLGEHDVPLVPEDAVVGVPHHEEAKHRVGDVDIEDEVERTRILGPGEFLNQLLQGVSGGIGVRRTTVPDPVEVDTQEVPPVVAEIDSVRVHHWDDLNREISPRAGNINISTATATHFEYQFLPQLRGYFMFGHEEIYEACHEYK